MRLRDVELASQLKMWLIGVDDSNSFYGGMGVTPYCIYIMIHGDMYVNF